MKAIDRAYNWMLEKAKGEHASFWLSVVSFLEGFISPIPPDPMLAVMVAVKPSKIYVYALTCTLTSVIGGILGFFFGAVLYDSVGKWILDLYGYSNTTIPNLNTIAFAAIAFKALTPIPYKVISIISGFMRVDLLVFISASLLSRFVRFFIVSAICKKYGDRFLQVFERYKVQICALIVVALATGFVLVAYI